MITTSSIQNEILGLVDVTQSIIKMTCVRGLGVGLFYMRLLSCDKIVQSWIEMVNISIYLLHDTFLLYVILWWHSITLSLTQSTYTMWYTTTTYIYHYPWHLPHHNWCPTHHPKIPKVNFFCGQIFMEGVHNNLSPPPPPPSPPPPLGDGSRDGPNQFYLHLWCLYMTQGISNFDRWGRTPTTRPHRLPFLWYHHTLGLV